MTVTIDELLAMDGRVTIINAGRSAGATEIRGAVRYRPSDLLHADRLALPIASAMPVVLYDAHGPHDDLTAIAQKIRADIAPDVRILDAELSDYTQRGGPTQEPSMEQVVPPHTAAEASELDRRA